MEPIRIGGIVAQSVVDGPGLRLAVFTQGCPHNCPGCHNPETHDFAGGSDTAVADILEIFDQNPLLQGVTLTGGEPLCQAEALLPLAEEVLRRGKDIVCFTGYTLEELLEMRESNPSLRALLDKITLLIDSRFDLAQRDLTLRFRGSRNQRALNLPESLRQGKAVWMPGYGGPDEVESGW